VARHRTSRLLRCLSMCTCVLFFGLCCPVVVWSQRLLHSNHGNRAACSAIGWHGTIPRCHHCFVEVLPPSFARFVPCNGFQARDAWRVDCLVSELIAAAGPVALTGATLEQLPGSWRLLYTSGFTTGGQSQQ
jgi:hypothetical protein